MTDHLDEELIAAVLVPPMIFARPGMHTAMCLRFRSAGYVEHCICNGERDR